MIITHTTSVAGLAFHSPLVWSNQTNGPLSYKSRGFILFVIIIQGRGPK